MFIIDDIINAIAADNASKAQQEQARAAMGLQREIYGQQRADQMPFLQTGQASLRDLYAMMQPGFQMQADPGFQFRMSEAQKALERSAAARGGLNSGGFAKALTRYSQGLASEEFGNRFNRLSNIAGMGQQSANALGQFGGQFANNMGQLYGALGNAQAAGAMGVGNAIAGGVQSLGNLALLAAGGGFGGAAGAAGVAGAGAARGAGATLIPRQGG